MRKEDQEKLKSFVRQETIKYLEDIKFIDIVAERENKKTRFSSEKGNTFKYPYLECTEFKIGNVENGECKIAFKWEVPYKVYRIGEGGKYIGVYPVPNTKLESWGNSLSVGITYNSESGEPNFQILELKINANYGKGESLI